MDYNIYNRSGEIVAQAATQVEAFGVVDYMFRTDLANAPFRCAPVPVVVEASVQAPKRSFFRRLFAA